MFIIKSLNFSVTKFINVENIPNLGEYIKTSYFREKYSKLGEQEVFKVEKILHHYNFDMCEINYTEIHLEL